MRIPINFTKIRRGFTRKALSTAAATGLLACTGLSYADSPEIMAPPLDTYSTLAATGGPAYVTPNSVFNWTEIPQDQQILITRAIFDRGGYQLYDAKGETIVVPFTNNNLYVMKFAHSTDGRMYLVNEGDAPVLYVPDEGYLDNATVSGARWYPFSDGFQPSQPVYMGLAPTWNDYVDMGWYPGMIGSGGFYSYNPFYPGALFLPTTGFFLDFGGHRFHHFNDFRNFHRHHRAPFRIGFHDRDVYRWAHHPELHRFDAGGRPYFAHRAFRGGHNSRFEHKTVRGIPPAVNPRRTTSGSGPTINEPRTFPGNRPMNNGPRTFPGNRPQTFEHRRFPVDRNRTNQQFTFPGNGPQMNHRMTGPWRQSWTTGHRSFQPAAPPTVQRPMIQSAPAAIPSPMIQSAPPPMANRGIGVYRSGMPSNSGVTYSPGSPSNNGVIFNRGMPANQGGNGNFGNRGGHHGFGGGGHMGR